MCRARTAPPRAVWQPEETARFLEHVFEDRLSAMYELAAYAGLRRAELCGHREGGEHDGQVGLDGVALVVIAALVAAAIPHPPQTRGTPRRFAQLGDHDWLRHRYLEEGASLQELAVEIGCSIRAVRRALAEARVRPRPQGRRVKRSSTTEPAV